MTETLIQTLNVDTIPPAIAMDGELKLGHTLYYDLEDMGSGLWIHRTVIEDDDEDYKKLAWEETISGNKAQGEILWDGKFADGEQAGIGEYFITLKISDAAGNERMQTAVVKVGLLSFLEEIPEFVPPASSLLPVGEGVQGTDEGSLSFGGANIPVTGAATSESNSAGGANNGAAGDESASISAGGTAVFNNETEYVQSGFTQGNESTSSPITNPNILWGAIAAATLGATLADWQRRRDEEEARLAALRNSGVGTEEKARHGNRAGRAAYEKKMQHKRIVGESQAKLNEKAKEKAEQAEKARQNLIAKNEDRAPVDMNKVNQLVQQAASQQAQDDYRAGERGYAVHQAEEKKKADQQAGLMAYYEGRKNGEETQEKQESWLDKFAATASSTRDNVTRVVGAVPDAWRGFLLSPLEIKKQIQGSNLVVSANQKTLNAVNSVTGWLEKNLPWTGVKSVPSNKLGYYESLAEQGLDINPTGNLSPRRWTDRLLDIVLDRESKTLIKETAGEAAKETVETATKGGLRNTLKAWSPAIFDAVIEGTFNAYDYTLGEKKNETDKLQKWAVSSGVDLGGSLITGGAAALTVAGVIAGIGYFLGAPITVPATLIIGGTIIVGTFFDMALEATGIKDVIKDKLNEYIDNKHLLTSSPAQPQMPVQTPSEYSPVTETPLPPPVTPAATMTPTLPPVNTPTPTPQITQTPEP